MLTESNVKGGFFFMNRCGGKRRGNTRILRGVLFAAALILVFSLTGCGKAREMPTDLFLGALDAELTVHTDEITYSVAVHLGEVQEEGKREVELLFLSPESLKGMKVRSAKGSVTVEKEGLAIEREHIGDLLLSAELLSPVEIVGRDRTVENERSMAVLYTSDGRVLYWDVQEERLVRVEKDSLSVTVEWIEAR